MSGVSYQQVLQNGGVQFVSDAIGSGIMGAYQSNTQHPFDRIFFRNTSDLVGQTLTFFQTPISGQYNVLNGGGSAVTKTAADTNWDMANQAQYAYLLSGMYLKIQTLEYQSFQTGVNDLTTWSDTLRGILEDSFISIVSEDKILTRQKAVHIPEGNALAGVAGVTGTAAAPVSQPVVSNGAPISNNKFSFGRNLLWVPKNTRFNVNLTFGASVLAASMAYKPAANHIFAEVRFEGVKFQAMV